MTKKEKKDKKPYDPNKKNIWTDFKAFISRGNVLDLAVGVIIGGAFNAIVTAVSKVLLSVATWGVPGGINGLVTVLPAANATQAGMDKSIEIVEGGKLVASLGQKFSASYLQKLAEALADKTYTSAVVDANPTLIESIKTTILSKYTLKGTEYVYNLSAMIDWGSIINAVISFLIIAATLFIIVRVANKSRKIREEKKVKWLEDYYSKYPELRPVPAPKEPTDHEILKEMLSVLKEQKESK